MALERGAAIAKQQWSLHHESVFEAAAPLLRSYLGMPSSLFHRLIDLWPTDSNESSVEPDSTCKTTTKT